MRAGHEQVLGGKCGRWGVERWVVVGCLWVAGTPG